VTLVEDDNVIQTFKTLGVGILPGESLELDGGMPDHTMHPDPAADSAVRVAR